MPWWKVKHWETTLQSQNTENSKQIFPEKELCGFSSNFHILVSASDLLFIFPSLVCLFCCRKICDRSWEYIYRTQTRECGNWDWGRAIPFLGTHKWYFCCSVGDHCQAICIVWYVYQLQKRASIWEGEGERCRTPPVPLPHPISQLIPVATPSKDDFPLVS